MRFKFNPFTNKLDRVVPLENGSAAGQMVFWDAGVNRWAHTEISELFWDDVNKRVGIGTSSPDTKLQVVGDSKFGDDNTNYLALANDGEVILHGTARITDHFNISAGALKPGSSSPTAGFSGNFPHLSFSNVSNQEAHFQMIIPHKWDDTEDIEICLVWYYAGAQDNGTVKWDFSYTSVKAGEDPTAAGTTITETTAGNHTTGQVIRTCFTTKVLASNLETEDDLGFKITRDQANDTLGTPAILLSVHIHYIKNKLGEAT